MRLPTTIKPLEIIFQEHPKVTKFAKYFQTERFSTLPYIVISQPHSHLHHLIYGLFVADKKGVLNNLKTGTKKQPEIKQDFIALDRNSNDIIYYSGGSSTDTGEHQSIKSFCKTYGRWPDGSWGQYECFKKRGTFHHLYSDENDSKLPEEPEFRQGVFAEIQKIRKQLKSSII